MADFEQPSATRAAPLRTSQACQRCRSLKTRCLPSTQTGVCQRCSSAGKDCLWADIPRRVKKLRAPSRISQVEHKIDGLVAKLVNAVGSASESQSAVAGEPSNVAAEASRRERWVRDKTVAPGSWMPVPSFEPEEHRLDEEIENAPDNTEADRRYLQKLRSIHNFGDREDIGQAPASLFQPSKRPEAPIEDNLVRQMLATGEADNLLNEYRQMSASFPFVIIPQGVSSSELHESRPMLLLAILTVASWKDHQRQMSLDQVYRSELAERTIIRPRRTLGLVQSVLVYLSWYHFVFSHKTQQIFFLHHLVIGLALDIGLHQDYQPLNFPQGPKLPPPSSEEQRERYRAFLGCYYLASMIAAGLQKPNLLKHTSYMTEWAQILNRDQEYESDAIICHLISLRQIDDQIHDTLFAREAQHLSLADARTSMHMRFMEAQLDTWKRESSGAACQRLLILSSSFTDLWLHSIALRRQPVQQPVIAESTQVNALLSALEAGKRFMDALLSFPAHEYHIISFSEWMRLPTVIMTVARLCMPTEAHTAAGWDVKAAQDRVRLDLCLENLCYRMQSLSTYVQGKQQHPDFWYAMRFINDLTKAWYMRKIRPTALISTHPTPSDLGCGGQERSEMSGPSSVTLSTHSTHQAGQRYDTVAGINYMRDINMDMGATDNVGDGPFAFMKDLDFDMEQFFDTGIWGDESYTGMGFGGGMPF